jgi:hypothetical protein
MLALWRIAAGMAESGSWGKVREGVVRGDQARRMKAGNHGAVGRHGEDRRPLKQQARIEAMERLARGESWDAILDSMVGREGYPSRQTLAKKWLKGLNPHRGKPGPRKRLADPGHADSGHRA